MRALILLTTFCFMTSISFAEEILLRDLDVQSSPRLSEYFKTKNIPSDYLVKDILESTDDKKVKSGLYKEIGGAIRENKNLSLEKKIALNDLFVGGLKDEDQRYYVSNRLRLPPFEKEYFSAEAKNIILDQGIDHIRNSHYLRILAVADVEDPDVDTRSISERADAFTGATGDILEALEAQHFAYYNSDLWTALVVEARKGNSEALSRILDDVRNTGKSKMVSHPEVVEDLGFIRQLEAVDVLVDFLFSDVPSANEEMDGHVGVIPLSFRAARAISLSLADYPFDYWDDYDYRKVQQAREFISNYEGEWRIIGKWKPEEETLAEVVEVTEESTTPEVATDKLVKVAAPGSSEEPVEQPSDWWLWLVGALVVLGGLAVVVRRKS